MCEPPDSGGDESSDHGAGEASDHGGDEGKNDDSDSTEKAEPRKDTGAKLARRIPRSWTRPSQAAEGRKGPC